MLAYGIVIRKRVYNLSCKLGFWMNIQVVELFAGVGGFRLGLESSSERFYTVWANQWEPSRKTQHAFDCYNIHFGKNSNCINEDISIVKNEAPKHNLLVGGFPCQDYSVARTGARGIEGKKGVLWWDIFDIAERNRPEYILLENVDRLLKSPASQRGRDFGVILKGLNDLGYAIEWRVINAADYGYAQRRRRTFIFATLNTTNHYKTIINNDKFNIISELGFFASEFNVQKDVLSKDNLIKHEISRKKYNSLVEVSNKFEARFCNAGVCIDGNIHTIEVTPTINQSLTLTNICLKEPVDKKYFLNGSLDKWVYLKGAKREPRVKPNGEEYFYTEGAMSFPDALNLPARTILTSESSVNRSSHVIQDYTTGKLRLLTPIECERLNGFPDDWTNTGMPEKFRYFVMGNALVVPLIERMGSRLIKIIDGSKIEFISKTKKQKICV